MRKVILFNLVLLAVAVGAAATWASAGAGTPAAPSSSMAGMPGMAAMPSRAPRCATRSRGRVSRQRSTSRTSTPRKRTATRSSRKMIPDMGWHFLNSKITGFDPTKPPILVYEKHGTTWQLGGARVGVPAEADDAAAAGRTLRSVPGGVPLRRRHVRSGGVAGRVREDGARVRGGVHLLAPEPGDAARLALVPEPDGDLLEHESARPPVQRRLTVTAYDRRRQRAGVGSSRSGGDGSRSPRR